MCKREKTGKATYWQRWHLCQVNKTIKYSKPNTGCHCDITVISPQMKLTQETQRAWSAHFSPAYLPKTMGKEKPTPSKHYKLPAMWLDGHPLQFVQNCRCINHHHLGKNTIATYWKWAINRQLCFCVHLFLCVHVSVCVFLCVHVSVRACFCACVFLCTRVSVHECFYECTETCICASVRVFLCACMFRCVHVSVHTCFCAWT